MADAHGTVWAVGERECSIQRRHQKIIEEAPSPLVERTPGMRAKLFDAARLAAEAIGYTGAGTVEFLADDDGDFFFLEMNTRLQVEHPVTEETTGLDLVELQLHVADGGRLDAEPPAARGHSIEVRLYAEDPAKDWQPQAGPVHRFEVPTARNANSRTLGRAGVRLDSGVVDGSVVSIFYDPMLAKVISYAPTRRQAAAMLADALARTRLHGVAHQPRPAGQRAAAPGVPRRRHRHRVLRHPRPGRAGRARWPTTAPSRCRRWPPRWPTPRTTASAQRFSRGLPSGWRNVASGYQAKTLRRRRGRRRTRCATASPAAASSCRGDDAVQPGVGDARPRWCSRSTAWSAPFDVARYGDDVFVDSPLGPVQLTAQPRFPDPDSAVAHGFAARADAGLGDPASAPRSATASRRASR